MQVVQQSVVQTSLKQSFALLHLNSGTAERHAGCSRSLHCTDCRQQPATYRHARRSDCILQPARGTSGSHRNRIAAAAALPVEANVPEPGSHSTSRDWHHLVISTCQEHGQLVKVVLRSKISTKGYDAPTHVSDNTSGSSATPYFPTRAVAHGQMPYKQLTLRPVMLKGKLQLQLSLLDARQDTTKNFTPEQAVLQLQTLLKLPWQSASIQTVTQTTNIQISKKGKVLIQTVKAPAAAGTALQADPDSSRTSSEGNRVLQQQQQKMLSTAGPISLHHDRVKAAPINGNVPDPFLQQIGLQTADGRIKANMQAKFTQINEFLKLLIHTGELEHIAHQQESHNAAATARDKSSPNSSSSSVHILDCGCGSSHLTFGTYHYLANILGFPVQLTGVDTNRALMDRSNRYCDNLGISDHARFITATIRDYQPQQQPAIVLALHACDTATDEALALGIRSGADVIMSVPCCHKDLHRQQQRHSSSSSVEMFAPLLDHGILRQRMLDLLTDTFRAQLLRLVGYKTDVVEFVSGEHTPRNLLIRAVKQRRQQQGQDASKQSKLAQQYQQLKEYWGVTPHLEKLLREDGLLPHQLS